MLCAKGNSYAEIAEMTQYSVSRIIHIISEYMKEGISKFLQENRGGAHHRKMSYEEEVEFLKNFEAQAKEGHCLTMADVISAYRERFPESPLSTIYALVKRHNWRVVVPRPKHPKAASPEAQEASKKLKQQSKK